MPSHNAFSLLAAALMGGLWLTGQPRSLPAQVQPGDARLYTDLLAMADTRRLDLSLVDRALASRWKPLRAAATLTIGQVGRDPGLKGASRLRSLLANEDADIARNAAYALGLLRDTASIPQLASALSSKGAVASEAAWALGEIGAAARTEILSALKEPRSLDVSVQLLLAAAKLRPLPVADIAPFLRRGPPAVTWAAAYAISRTRVAAGVRPLLALEGNSAVRPGSRAIALNPGNVAPYTDSLVSPARTRAEIARGLAKSAAGDSLGAQAFEVLRRLVRDKDSHVRVNAVRSLATYGPSALQMLLTSSRDQDPNVRIATAQSVSTVLTKGSPDFANLWGADTSLVYRASLLASATRAGLRPNELSEWATSHDWRLRAAVAAADGDSLDRSFALSRALPLTRDPDPRVREAAYGAIVPVASVALEDSVHAALLTGLRDPDFYVRATVLGALAERASVGDLPAVLASYEQAARDSANDARLAALQYIVGLWKKDSARIGESDRARLARLAVPTDPLERAAGRGVPAFESWRSVTPVARPAAFYDSVVRMIVVPALGGKPARATIHTVRGPIQLELFGAEAPLTVWNFLSLARSGYYRNTRFHRVVPNFVAQDGDPRDDGNGGPGYAIRDEMNPHRYERGAVGMALSGPDTGGSQYFITHSPQPHLDGHYTVFGRVVKGFDVLDKIVQGDLISRVDPK